MVNHGLSFHKKTHKAKCTIFESRFCSKVGGVSGKIEQPCPSGFYSLNGLFIFMDSESVANNDIIRLQRWCQLLLNLFDMAEYDQIIAASEVR